jgi:1-deoxy-D-xylulose 5-phosphate reductoisomerase
LTANTAPSGNLLLQVRHKEIEKIFLTCSGGPFRNKTTEELRKLTAEDALRHPTWNMGKRITIDSATLMNKGFEVIEAKWLFDVQTSQIEVIIHPQSILHSAVMFRDGSVIGQFSLARHETSYPVCLIISGTIQKFIPPAFIFSNENIDF